MRGELTEFAVSFLIMPDTMHYPSLAALVNDRSTALSKGPIALILAEDDVELDSTIGHHQSLGFRAVIVFASTDAIIADDLATSIHRVDCDPLADDMMPRIVNKICDAAPDIWLHYCYNAEYLFYPFCENRTIGEMTAFAAEERRSAVLTYTIDLYAGDLSAHPSAVARDDAYLDRSGYYALAREDAAYAPMDRQLDVFGGLRWRFEEHVPWTRRRIDRVSIFRTKPGLKLNSDHTFNDPEYNTYACPWHHSLTASICSFRIAKALRRNPGSRFEIDSFRWEQSTAFTWKSQQLLDLGFMEPGQWV